METRFIPEHKQPHPVEIFLNENPYAAVRIWICGRQRTLRMGMSGCIILMTGRKYGRYFREWYKIDKYRLPKPVTEESLASDENVLLAKFKKLAATASFTNQWLRDIMSADPTKSLYENGITTGSWRDGEVIRLATIEKWAGTNIMQNFWYAMRNKEKYESPRFDFQGYDGTIWCVPEGDGGMNACFNKEYRGCANGYYYSLINDKCVILCDID